MSLVDAGAAREAVTQLEALARELAGRNFDARVTCGGRLPSLCAINPTMLSSPETIAVASADGGEWWFWWSWGARIARITDVETAAFKIAYVLTPPVAERAAMQMKTPKAPEVITFERAYPGTVDQPRQVRADLARIAAGCPVADDLVALASELAANAVLHSCSGHPGGTFTVHAALYPGDYAWVEVTDPGGAWKPVGGDDEHGRGLQVVAVIAGDGNWGIEGNASSRVAWFRLG